MKAQKYSESMHVGGMRARVTIEKVREAGCDLIAPHVRFKLEIPGRTDWHVAIQNEPLAEYLLNDLSAVEMLVDIEDNARKLIALGCENAEGIYRAAVQYSIAGWVNRMELEQKRAEG